MRIARTEYQSHPVDSLVGVIATRAIPQDPWKAWSRGLHGVLFLLSALVFVSPFWMGNSMPPLVRASTLVAGGVLLVLGLAGLRMAGGQDLRRDSAGRPGNRGRRREPSRNGWLMVVEGLSSLTGVWLIFSPMVFSGTALAPGLALAALGSAIFLVAEGGSLADLNQKVPAP
jgi:hypothetical protein